jgi:CheY-like chemotaxis protein/nitrogen-specific signal transduction histidine kinase
MVPELEALGRTLNELATTLQLNDAIRTNAEKQLEQARDIAQAASRSKTTFLAALGHDLRQPLHSMSLSASFLSMRLAGKPDAMVAERMQRSIANLSELVNAVLDVSQLEAGLVRAQVEDVHMPVLLQGVMDEFTEAAAEKGVALKVAPSDESVRSDPRLLRRILENLLGNAVKYTPAGGTVRVDSVRDEATVLISITDTGPGIPHEQQAEIWEEFRQLNNPARDHSKGLGLGLAIVRRMSELLGHEVTCHSAAGLGSTFIVRVPAALRRLAPSVSPETPSLSGRALLVDDDLDIVASTADLLKAWGLHVVSCASAEEALPHIAEPQAAFDVLITDYRLPGLSGLTVVDAARRRFPLLCILVTGDVGTALSEQVPADVITLSKPVSVTSLAAALHPLTAAHGR